MQARIEGVIMSHLFVLHGTDAIIRLFIHHLQFLVSIRFGKGLQSCHLAASSAYKKKPNTFYSFL